MNTGAPIFTKKAACQDCYKCIRECPVKAIKVEGGYASVVPDLCVLCGHCVDVCPHGAKQVRDDVPRAKGLLEEKAVVVLSLAPSFVTEFPGVRPEALVAALRQLGFTHVSETALGAEMVSAQMGETLSDTKPDLHISTACPTAVAYFEKYAPSFAPKLTPVLSPMLTHGLFLRQRFGPDIAVVFVGPCVAKKIEADRHPEIIEVALTFEDLRRWFDQAGVDPGQAQVGEEDRFVPRRSREGGLYPVEGGMNDSITGQRPGLAATCQFLASSGLPGFANTLTGLEGRVMKTNLFLELLACPGGCVNGPKSAHRQSTVCKRLDVEAYARPPQSPAALGFSIRSPYGAKAVPMPDFSEEQIRGALISVGKRGKADELNCGGCGYDSCRDFARAFLVGRAEATMCVTNMRTLAQKKANVLIQKMPSAVVIVDREMRVVECNPVFRRLFAPKGNPDPEGPVVEGAPLSDLMPFQTLFESVMARGEDLVEKDLRFKGLILHSLLFTIEKGALVGAVFEDITRPATQREEVIKRARQVIEQNLKTVQEIAFLIGENAADSEIILSSIVASFQAGEEGAPNG